MWLWSQNFYSKREHKKGNNSVKFVETNIKFLFSNTSVTGYIGFLQAMPFPRSLYLPLEIPVENMLTVKNTNPQERILYERESTDQQTNRIGKLII